MVNDDCIQQLGRVLLVRCGHQPLDGESGSSGVGAGTIVSRARNGGARTVLLDVSGSPYADSGGLRWLLRLRREVEDNGLTLCTVATPHSRVWRNLALLKADLTLYGDLHDAWLQASHPYRHSAHTAAIPMSIS